MPIYTLTFRYPNGRTHEVEEEIQSRLAVGQEFERFGRTWRVASSSVMRGRRPHVSLSEPEAIECYQVSDRRT